MIIKISIKKNRIKVTLNIKKSTKFTFDFTKNIIFIIKTPLATRPFIHINILSTFLVQGDPLKNR